MANPIWSFPARLVGARGNNATVNSYVQAPISINLRRPLTIMGWFNPSDALDYRTLFSIESDECPISLINVFLPPRSMNVGFHYMVDTNPQNRSAGPTAPPPAPGPGQWFHLGVIIQNNTVTIFINGQKTSTSSIKPLFNPGGKILTLGRTKYPLSSTLPMSAQWNGTIYSVKVYSRAVSDEIILEDSEESPTS